ncbi:alpha-mannosidase 2 isoform X2 [Lepeophtheirus salmonis]|uniref:alpha-mannosidase 2 isoform X2 n=2 Tax=Lepeophtheirus salmonis TaxID=72036 RepID=UPI003AF3D422
MVRYKKYFLCLTFFAGVMFMKLLNLENFLENSMISLPHFNLNSSATKKVSVKSHLSENIYIVPQSCEAVQSYPADIVTNTVFPKLKFDPEWIDKREFWNNKFEKRYQERRKLWSKLPLKVFIVPHSHNDPGWLKTIETYFQSATNKIINSAVDKLSKFQNMTFIWTEISFLHMWWESASQIRKENLKRLVKEGRFEIATGGWVMTDEANVHIYSMVDQLIEGHTWIKNTFDTKPKTSWSIDPFGHGKTFPYVLRISGIDSMLIMRIHYAWKEWFAKNQNGDFLWSQSWDRYGDYSILCHNFPYDIYSIKGSCGPSSKICLEFNFRKIPGEFNEYTARFTPITSTNVEERAELLIEQYGKTGSLYPHNVVLVPLGDDFTFNEDLEWDQQFSNYQKLINFINANFNKYFVDIRFGTLKDYFTAVKERMSDFHTLSGDFFVYSDVFSEGRPAYWSGYFTTRPRLKRLARKIESNLRSAEIIFTLAYNSARKSANDFFIDRFQSIYSSDLVPARRASALFQHHDAITGTSKHYVMMDYEHKLLKALNQLNIVQIEGFLYFLSSKGLHIRPDMNTQLKEPNPISMDEDLLIFNSLVTQRYEFIQILIKKTSVSKERNLQVIDLKYNKSLSYQINPMLNSDGFSHMYLLELSFFVELEPLSITVVQIKQTEYEQPTKKTIVYCNNYEKNYSNNYFDYQNLNDGDVSLENKMYQLVISERGKFLISLTHKKARNSDNLEIYFGKYATSQFRSGAYLFKPDIVEVLDMFDVEKHMAEVMVVSGQIFSQFSVLFQVPSKKAFTNKLESKPGYFVHTIRLYHAPVNKELSQDLFMRFTSNTIDNGKNPVIYTDSSGFQMQKRQKVENIGIEGNYFPITSSAFIEDDENRLTLLVNHAQGAASWETGVLEVMVDRRSSYDDSRGMGEGVLDSKLTKHQYWLLFEPKINQNNHIKNGGTKELSLSSSAQQLSRRLNYPIEYFFIKNRSDSPKKLSFLHDNFQFPCDIHLFNLRTLSVPNTTPNNIPSDSALLILHKQSADCGFYHISCKEGTVINKKYMFSQHIVNVRNIIRTSLTGLYENEKLVDLSKLLTELRPMTLNTFRVRF